MTQQQAYPFVRGPKMKRMCYYNAFEHIRLNRGGGWVVCHGILQPGPRYECEVAGPVGHAWNEIDRDGERWAWDPTLAIWAPAEGYRREGGVSYVVEYTEVALLALYEQTKHSGPWDERMTDAAHADQEAYKRRSIRPGPGETQE